MQPKRKRHQFCEKHQMSYPPESTCYACRTGQPPKSTPPPAISLRRIIITARTMERVQGWPRRRAIRFALEKARRAPRAPTPRRSLMSGETQEFLNHRNRSMR